MNGIPVAIQEYLYFKIKKYYMKFLIGLIAIMGIVSCSSDDDRSNTKVDEVSINGTWKPSRYEFKGKAIRYPLAKRKDRYILIQIFPEFMKDMIRMHPQETA